MQAGGAVYVGGEGFAVRGGEPGPQDPGHSCVGTASGAVEEVYSVAACSGVDEDECLFCGGVRLVCDGARLCCGGARLFIVLPGIGDGTEIECLPSGFLCFVTVSRFSCPDRATCGFRFASGGVAFVGSRLVQLIFFSSVGWETWDVEAKPAIPDGMPVLVDDDLAFADDGGPRPTVAVNRWLRELPSSGAPAVGSWAVYARVLRDWMVFLSEHGIGVFADRERLRAGLGAYATYRAEGPEQARFAATTWNRHMSVLSCFYQWAVAEGHALAVPFSYAQAQVGHGDMMRGVRVNLARRRTPMRHVTIKYLEADFAELFVRALGGLVPDGTPDVGYRGRELARNSAVAGLALASGLRRQEFSYLLVYEVPALPPLPGRLPIPLAVPAGVTKGRKHRVTWIDYPVLESVHRYVGLDRAASVAGSSWRPPQRWGEPLVVTEADPVGGRVNGRRVRWDGLRPGQRRRLVTPWWVVSAGGPLRWWPVHRVGQRVHPGLGSDPGTLRVTVPACASAPAAPQLFDGDSGAAGRWLLRAGRPTGGRDRYRGRPGRCAGIVSGQIRSDDGAS